MQGAMVELLRKTFFKTVVINNFVHMQGAMVELLRRTLWNMVINRFRAHARGHRLICSHCSEQCQSSTRRGTRAHGSRSRSRSRSRNIYFSNTSWRNMNKQGYCGVRDSTDTGTRVLSWVHGHGHGHGVFILATSSKVAQIKWPQNNIMIIMDEWYHTFPFRELFLVTALTF